MKDDQKNIYYIGIIRNLLLFLSCFLFIFISEEFVEYDPFYVGYNVLFRAGEWTHLDVHLKRFSFETKGPSSLRYAAVVLPNKCDEENGILFAPFSW